VPDCAAQKVAVRSATATAAGILAVNMMFPFARQFSPGDPAIWAVECNTFGIADWCKKISEKCLNMSG
jgi:hypothetical protein